MRIGVHLIGWKVQEYWDFRSVMDGNRCVSGVTSPTALFTACNEGKFVYCSKLLWHVEVDSHEVCVFRGCKIENMGKMDNG